MARRYCSLLAISACAAKRLYAGWPDVLRG